MHTHASNRARSSAGASKSRRRNRVARWARVAVAAAAPVLGAAALAAPAVAQSAPDASSHYKFVTLDNQADTTFNQLLGINQHGLIAGYFGSGAQGHPNQGYLLSAPYGQGNYRSENWPESAQTQVTGLNDHGVTVGFWSSTNNAAVGNNPPVNDNRAFVSVHGYYVDGDYPTSSPATPPVDQLLGVNDNDIAVGFYTDAAGNTHAYSFNIRHNQFNKISPSGIANPTAAGINNKNDVAGFGTDAAGNTVGFLLKRDGHITILSVPGSSMTQPLGVNDNDEVVGVYQTANGDMFGFTWAPQQGFQTIDDPNGMGTTTINGVNDKGQLVGFYTDTAGNTDGLLATPRHH
jgi:hypothetical protein